MSYLVLIMLKKPRTSIPTFSSSNATPVDLSVRTEMTKQNPLINVEMDEALKAAMVTSLERKLNELSSQTKRSEGKL